MAVALWVPRASAAGRCRMLRTASRPPAPRGKPTGRGGWRGYRPRLAGLALRAAGRFRNRLADVPGSVSMMMRFFGAMMGFVRASQPCGVGKVRVVRGQGCQYRRGTEDNRDSEQKPLVSKGGRRAAESGIRQWTAVAGAQFRPPALLGLKKGSLEAPRGGAR